MTANKPSKEQAVKIEPTKEPDRYKEQAKEQERISEIEDRIAENKAQRYSRNG